MFSRSLKLPVTEPIIAFWPIEATIRRDVDKIEFSGGMFMYPEMMVAPMRQELASAGIAEARTAADVEKAIQEKGTVMVVVNSICGCAAGRMRPGVRAAIQSGTRPDRMITVFSGRSEEHTSELQS